jgi:hypothetical protein
VAWDLRLTVADFLIEGIQVKPGELKAMNKQERQVTLEQQYVSLTVRQDIVAYVLMYLEQQYVTTVHYLWETWMRMEGTYVSQCDRIW